MPRSRARAIRKRTRVARSGFWLGVSRMALHSASSSGARAAIPSCWVCSSIRMSAACTSASHKGFRRYEGLYGCELLTRLETGRNTDVADTSSSHQAPPSVASTAGSTVAGNTQCSPGGVARTRQGRPRRHHRHGERTALLRPHPFQNEHDAREVERALGEGREHARPWLIVRIRGVQLSVGYHCVWEHVHTCNRLQSPDSECWL